MVQFAEPMAGGLARFIQGLPRIEQMIAVATCFDPAGGGAAQSRAGLQQPTVVEHPVARARPLPQQCFVGDAETGAGGAEFADEQAGADEGFNQQARVVAEG